jgi:two-component system, response regulator / RNA-binding antiterminator
MSHFNRLETIIVCSDSLKNEAAIKASLSHNALHVMSCRLVQLEATARENPTAAVVVFWSAVTAELRLIIEFCTAKNLPLLVIIPSVSSNNINQLLVTNDFVLLPYSPDTDFVPWLEYAQQVRDKAMSVNQEMIALTNKLEERKWVDKAKGLLMKLHSIDEDSAYRALRSSAMQKSLSMSQIAKNVIHTFEMVN